jgi:hypothetical protein
MGSVTVEPYERFDVQVVHSVVEVTTRAPLIGS